MSIPFVEKEKKVFFKNLLTFLPTYAIIVSVGEGNTDKTK